VPEKCVKKEKEEGDDDGGGGSGNDDDGNEHKPFIQRFHLLLPGFLRERDESESR
jgi:hypothetical protein